ncbi:MAG: cobalamin B12-binding domain-containing protein [Myxococcota bacterium]
MSTIEAHIIPRLMLAHRTGHEPLNDAGPDSDGRLPPTRIEIARCADLAVAQDTTSLRSLFSRLMEEGLTQESLLLHLIAPAAKLLGDQWLDDARSFVDVTVGLGTLQRSLTLLCRQSERPSHRGLVVLLAAPGEQHTLGVHVVAEQIRREGWAAQVETGLDTGALADLVANEHVDMVGLSVSHADLITTLPSLLETVREASQNPDIRIVVGGCEDLAEHAEALDFTYCRSAEDALALLPGATALAR